MCQHDNRNAGILIFQLLCQLESVSISNTQHFNDEVNVIIFQYIGSFFCRIGMYKNRRIPEVQRYVFIKNMLVNPSVFFKHIKIILTTNYQNFSDSFLHEQIERSIREVYKICTLVIAAIFRHYCIDINTLIPE